MKTYEVRMTLICNVVVDAENEKDACDAACDGTSFGDCEFIESTTLELTGKQEIESAKRHAHQVVEY